MLLVDITDIKSFMDKLLRQEVFNLFYVRNIYLQTFVRYEINCILDKEYFPPDERARFEDGEFKRNYAQWNEMQQLVFALIKGGKLPRALKIIMSLPEQEVSKLDDNASAMFLNIAYENGLLQCSTGTSQKVFSLNKSADIAWEDYVLKFLTVNKIEYIQ